MTVPTTLEQTEVQRPRPARIRRAGTAQPWGGVDRVLFTFPGTPDAAERSHRAVPAPKATAGRHLRSTR